MIIKTLACAAVIGLLPAIAMACTGHSKQTQSCAPGTVWDSVSHSCVEQINS